MKLEECVIFIYTEIGFVFDDCNIFISCPYRSRKDFIKKNKGDNFKILKEYKLAEILKHSQDTDYIKIKNLEASLVEAREIIRPAIEYEEGDTNHKWTWITEAKGWLKKNSEVGE